jgi:hypothetical protein
MDVYKYTMFRAPELEKSQMKGHPNGSMRLNMCGMKREEERGGGRDDRGRRVARDPIAFYRVHVSLPLLKLIVTLKFRTFRGDLQGR